MDRITDLTNNLSAEKIAALVVAGFLVLLILILIIIKLRKRIKPEKFQRKWLSLQSKLSNRNNWLESVVEADELLKEALKKNKIKGKTTGEMLVNAEKMFTSKDEVWFAHKYVKVKEADPTSKLEKRDVKRALLALRQAIKDLGAFDPKRRKK